MKNQVAFSLAALALLARPAGAQDRDPKFKLFVDGVYAFKLDYTESRSFEEFTEIGSASVDYAQDAGPGFGVAFQWRFLQRLAVRGAFTYVMRDGTAHYDASFPHPLYLNRPRSVGGEVPGLSEKETSVHFDLVFTGQAGRVDFSLFGGGSLIKVEAELLTSFTRNEVYPFDEVTVTAVGQATVSDTPFGFNVGAGADWRLSSRVAVGAQFFFSRAKAKLATPSGGSLEIDAGGPHVTLGVRLMF